MKRRAGEAVKEKRKPWWPENDWKGYIRDTWPILLIMLATYAGMIALYGLWTFEMITLGQALLWGVPAFIFFNIGLIGAVSSSRVHFGMTDEKIDALIEHMKEQNREQAKQELSRTPADNGDKGADADK